MKKYVFIVGFIFIAGFTAKAQTTTKIKVEGNCGMCKSNIEKAAKSAGATSASWDKAAKLLTVSYNASSSQEKIENAIAAVGYDTENKVADKEAYEKLEECCQYDRAAKNASCCKDMKCKADKSCCKENTCAKDKDCCKKN